jgi:hypothetical protein
MFESVATHTAVTVRRGVLASLGFVYAFCIVGCGKFADSTPAQAQVTQICGKFNFVVANKSEASKARSAFYEANIRFHGLDFADDRFTGESKFIFGGQTFVLDGLDSYMTRVGDPPLTLGIKAYSTVVNSPSRQTVPCTFPNAAIAFDDMKAAISEKWKVNVELESPEYGRQRVASRIKDDR